MLATSCQPPRHQNPTQLYWTQPQLFIFTMRTHRLKLSLTCSLFACFISASVLWMSRWFLESSWSNFFVSWLQSFSSSSFWRISSLLFWDTLDICPQRRETDVRHSNTRTPDWRRWELSVRYPAVMSALVRRDDFTVQSVGFVHHCFVLLLHSERCVLQISLLPGDWWCHLLPETQNSVQTRTDHNKYQRVKLNAPRHVHCHHGRLRCDSNHLILKPPEGFLIHTS